MGHSHIAVDLLAERLNTIFARRNFHLQVIHPAIFAESVHAAQRENILLVDLLITDGAVAAMTIRKRGCHLRELACEGLIKLETKAELKSVLLVAKPSLHIVLIPLVMSCYDHERVDVEKK